MNDVFTEQSTSSASRETRVVNGADPEAVLAAAPVWPVLLPDAAAMRTGRFHAADLLWHDTHVFRAPLENARRALAVVRQLLSRRRPLRGGEDEFLALYSHLEGGDPQVADGIWPDPRAYHWTRAAYGLVSGCCTGAPLSKPLVDYVQALGETAPATALTRHLDHFKAFVLGVACTRGTDCRFPSPLKVSLPFSIPGVRWLLDGNGVIEIQGMSAGRIGITVAGTTGCIPLSSSGSSPAGVVLRRECPTARHDGHDLRLDPHALAVPGLDYAEPALRAGRAYQEQHIPLVQAALQNIQRYAPETFAHFRRTIGVAALKPPAWGGYDDYSEPELPGAFFASAIPNPLELADHFIHELHHNRMSSIEEYGPLFDAARGDAFGDTRFYVPWRDKLRALWGAFHAIFVFVAVARYWRNVYKDPALAAEDRDYAVDRLLRLPRQLRLAVGMQQRFAHLTPMGQVILEQFAHDVDDLRRDVDRLGLPADAPAWNVGEDGRYVREVSRDDGRPLTVNEYLREHLRRTDVHQQCAGLLPELG